MIHKTTTFTFFFNQPICSGANGVKIKVWSKRENIRRHQWQVFKAGVSKEWNVFNHKNEPWTVKHPLFTVSQQLSDTVSASRRALLCKLMLSGPTVTECFSASSDCRNSIIQH